MSAELDKQEKRKRAPGRVGVVLYQSAHTSQYPIGQFCRHKSSITKKASPFPRSAKDCVGVLVGLCRGLR